MRVRSQKYWAWSIPVITIVAALGLWQLLTMTGVLRRDQFPTMIETFEVLARLVAGPELWNSVWSTMTGWFLGMVVVSVSAMVVGALLAFNSIAFRSTATLIEIFKAIPAIAVLPLVILVMGSTMEMKVFLIAFAAFWGLLIQVIYGVRSIDPVVLDTAKALGVSGPRRFFVITIPSASPYIATGMRIASAQAMILAVIAELVGGAAGVGRNILIAQNSGVTGYPTMYAYILVTGFLGVLLTGAFFLLERKVMHWHESQRNIRANERGAK